MQVARSTDGTVLMLIAKDAVDQSFLRAILKVIEAGEMNDSDKPREEA